MPPESHWVEIAGIAGAGKSTLTRVLVDRYRGYRVADSLHTRLPAHWPYVAHGIPRMLPLLVRSARHRPLLSWDELKYVLYLTEWNRFLHARLEHRSPVTILDQGPIFALARLLWGGKQFTRGRWFQAWLTEVAGRWAVELDTIVFLSAPDDVLLDRINHRDRPHDAKGVSRRDALELINTHRAAYARVFEVTDRLGRPRVLHFDSSRMSATAIAEQLDAIFQTKRTQRLTDRLPTVTLSRGADIGIRARETRGRSSREVGAGGNEFE